jgi:hypothetical protein
MQIAAVLAGYRRRRPTTWRNDGEEDKEVMALQRRSSSGRGRLSGAHGLAEEIFTEIEHFAGYGFNKSHSAAYALIAYQTAWLKTHHPVEYMAALLTSEAADTDKIVKYIAECREMGIKVLPPDVNASGSSFTVVEDSIRFGLAAVKNVGEGPSSRSSRARAHGRSRRFSISAPSRSARVNKRARGVVSAGARLVGPARPADGGARPGDGSRPGTQRTATTGRSASSPPPAAADGANPRTPEWPEHQLLASRRRRSASTSPGTRSASSPGISRN